MAKKVTSKKPLFGNKRSHALNATRKQQKPNLQKSNGVITSAREMKKDKKNSK